VVLPGGQRSRITSVETFDGPLEEASSSLSVTVRLDHDIDVSRGDLIASADHPPQVEREFDATVCWFTDPALTAGRRLRVKHTTRVTPAQVRSVEARLDISSLELGPAEVLEPNDIGVARFVVGTPLVVDHYHRNRVTGSFVLIDELTNATVGAGMVGAPVLAVAPSG